MERTMRVNNALAIATWCDQNNIGEHSTLSLSRHHVQLDIFFGSNEFHARRAKCIILAGSSYTPDYDVDLLENVNCWRLKLQWELPEKE